jgi:hypothetical protein
MSAALYPTPTRLDLLAAIARGELDGQARNWYDRDGRQRTVAVRAMQREGWVAPGDPPPAGRITAATMAAGRSVLTSAGRCCRCGSTSLHITVCEHVIEDSATEAARWHYGAETSDRRSPVSLGLEQALCATCWSRL